MAENVLATRNIYTLLLEIFDYCKFICDIITIVKVCKLIGGIPLKKKLTIPLVIAVVAFAIVVAVTAFVLTLKLIAPDSGQVAVVSPTATPIVEVNPLNIKYQDSIQFGLDGQTYALINKTLWKWGVPDNEDEKKIYLTPTKLLDGVMKLYEGGYACFYAVRTDGSLWGWGYNEYGQLLDGTKKASMEPKMIVNAVREFKVFGDFNEFIKINGETKEFGADESNDEKTFKELKNIKLSFDTFDAKYTKLFYTGDKKIWALKGDKLIQVLTEVEYFDYQRIGIAIRTDGSLWTLGENIDGSLGIGDKGISGTFISFSITPHKILDGVKKAGIFGEHDQIYTCYAIKNDNSLWMWGYDEIVLGRNGKGSSRPFKVLNNVKTIIANPIGCACVVKTDGSLWVWGRSRDNDAKVIDYSKVMDHVKLILGDGYITGGIDIIKTDGSYWSLNKFAKPVKLANIYETLGNSYDGSFFKEKDGSLWIWDYKKRTKVLNEFKYFFSLENTFYAIKNDGTVWGWGFGYVGDGTNISRDKPVQIKFNEK